jgi:2-amino-4-hydroxy-6-hydroxymethyldihydropteridine diphosphokinase
VHPPDSNVLVALGSNLGDSVATIHAAFARLEQFSAGELRRSSLWQTLPVDCPPRSPPFINAGVAFAPLPGETPESLLAKLQALEKEFGRRPKVVMNEARPLDLDLIAFGNEVRNTPALILPHPRARQRHFVLQPLSEVAPQFMLPGETRSIEQLLAGLSSGEQMNRIA